MALTSSSRRLLCIALLFGATSAYAGEPKVVIGSVSAKTQAGEFSGALREALRSELRGSGVEATPTQGRYVLSAKLVKLESERKGGSVRTTAVVSLTLMRARENTLQATLSGRASTTEDTGSALDETRNEVLRAAVRSALRRLPEAVAGRKASGS